jgi:hypothetical protein
MSNAPGFLRLPLLRLRFFDMVFPPNIGNSKIRDFRPRALLRRLRRGFALVAGAASAFRRLRRARRGFLRAAIIFLKARRLAAVNL